MYFLAGLLGMMALGSVAIAGTVTDEDDGAPEDEGVRGTDTPRDLSDDPFPAASLFAQMGLINVPEGEVDGAVYASDVTPFVDVMEAMGILPLGDFLVDEGGRGALPPDVLGFDPAEEHLVVLYDDSLYDDDADAPDPQLDMRPRAEDPDWMYILLDGAVVASLPTQEAPPLSAIVLMGESAAAALQLA